jgi:hypothetical protein
VQCHALIYMLALIANGRSASWHVPLPSTLSQPLCGRCYRNKRSRESSIKRGLLIICYTAYRLLPRKQRDRKYAAGLFKVHYLILMKGSILPCFLGFVFRISVVSVKSWQVPRSHLVLLLILRAPDLTSYARSAGRSGALKWQAYNPG